MELRIYDDETKTMAVVHDNIDGVFWNVPSVRKSASAMIVSKIIQDIAALKELREKAGA
jgi:hypothetical protein